jgi:hypothetical protein
MRTLNWAEVPVAASECAHAMCKATPATTNWQQTGRTGTPHVHRTTCPQAHAGRMVSRCKAATGGARTLLNASLHVSCTWGGGADHQVNACAATQAVLQDIHTPGDTQTSSAPANTL